MSVIYFLYSTILAPNGTSFCSQIRCPDISSASSSVKVSLIVVEFVRPYQGGCPVIRQ